MAKQGGGGGGGGQQEGGGSDSLSIMVLFMGLMVVLWITRAYYFPYIFKLKYYELVFINKFTAVSPDAATALINAIYNPTQLNQAEILYTLSLAGNYFKYPVAILFIIFAAIIYIKSPANKFNKSFNMTTFRAQEKVNYPQIIPPSKLDLINTKINEGPWASAMTPMAFAKKHDLLEIITNPNPNQIGEAVKIPRLIEGRARQQFASQLGYIWTGPENLPLHTKALYAAFIAAANHDRKAAINFLRQINVSLEFGTTPNFSGTDELLAKHKDSKVVKKMQPRHAYVMTMMAASLELARSNGVLACADFLWLKIIDRNLWYMLNNVGRRSAFPEVAGAMAHWRIESRMQRKLMTPMIEEAVKALKIALLEIIYNEENEY